MWFLLTGTPPGAMVADGQATRIGAEKLRGVPKIVRHLLNRMLSPDPAARPQDPVALAAYLQTCLARVDRREKIERRFGVPLLAKARVAVAQPRMPIPIKPLAWAAGILVLAAFAIVFLPWPLAQKRTAPVVEQERAPLPQNQPNEVAVVQKDSLGRMSDTDDAIAPAPAIVPSNLPADEIPRDETARTVANNQPAIEPPPPAEGPAESDTVSGPAVAANSSQSQPMEANLPEAEPNNADSVPSPVNAQTNEPHQATTVANEGSNVPAPIIAEKNEAPEAESLSAPPEPTPLAEEEPMKVAQRTPPPKKATKTSLTKRPTKSRAVAAKAERSKTRTVTRSTKRSTSGSAQSRRVAHAAKRAQPLPKIRVGSARAELVGTTSDGKWILSVAESGQRVIVPPPPGYGE